MKMPMKGKAASAKFDKAKKGMPAEKKAAMPPLDPLKVLMGCKGKKK